MSHVIPVFFIPVKKDEIPGQLHDWQDVNDLLNKYYEQRHTYGVRISSSRNWWFEKIFHDSAETLGVQNLDFILDEITLLDAEDLQKTKQALVLFVASFSKDKFPLSLEETNKIWSFRREVDFATIKQMFKKAVNESKPFYECYAVDGADTYEGLFDFFSFVKMLQSAIVDALENEKCLLIVRPQP
jgi:hypothetical protein